MRAAWCLGRLWMRHVSRVYVREAAQEVFGPADAVLAWGAGVQGEATRSKVAFGSGKMAIREWWKTRNLDRCALKV